MVSKETLRNHHNMSSSPWYTVRRKIESRAGDQILFFVWTFVNDVYLFVSKQASAEKTTAHNAEVSELKQSLE